MKFFDNIKQNPKSIEFVKFCIIGCICTTIDAGIFYAIHSSTGYRIAMICGFCISIIFNYLLNTYWSFKAKPTISNIVGFLVAHCLNIFFVRISLMWLFVDLLQITDGIAYIPTLLISTVTNFLIIRFIMKRTHKSD